MKTAPTLNIRTGYKNQLNSDQDEDFTYLGHGMPNTADAPGTYGFLDYNYTSIGERIARKFNTGGGLQTDDYKRNGASNRLNKIEEASTFDRTFTYDAAGNTVLDVRSGGNYSYTYNERGRMDSISLNGVLQAEYDTGNGVLILLREYIWMGDLPVAIIEHTGIRTDQIDRPTFATDASRDHLGRALRRRPHRNRRPDILTLPRPMVPNRNRPAPKLDARL